MKPSRINIQHLDFASAFYYPNQILENSERSKFIILGAAKSGTTMTAGYLMSHPNMITFGELFTGWLLWHYPTFHNNPVLQNVHVYELWENSPASFMHVVFNYPYNYSKLEAVGWKMTYENLETKPLAKPLLDTPGLKVVHLKRRNHLKLHVSSLVAAKRTSAGKTQNAYASDDVETNISVRVNPDDFKAFSKNTLKLESKYDELFKDNNVLNCYYEDIVDSGMQDILSFLGVRQCKLKPITYKVRQQPIEDVVENYEEVKPSLGVRL